MSVLEFALRNLRRRPSRTLLTVAAIALGVAAVVALTSIAWGFEASWQKANDERGTDLIVTRRASENAMPSPFAAERIRKTLIGLPRVKEVAGLLSEMLGVGEGSPPLFVFGWERGSYLWDHLQIKSGQWPASDSEPVVAIGATAAELLHKNVGDSVEIEGQQFRVAGVFESAATIENGAILMTLAQAQEITDKPGKVNILNLRLDGDVTETELEAIKSQVLQMLPGFVAVTSGELVRQNAVVRISKAMSGATIIIASLVGALVVFNTMLMSITERTREIGILLALGWRRGTVMKLVFGEAAALTFLGGLLGIVVGVVLTLGLEHLDLMRGKIDAVFSLAFFAKVLAMAVLLGIGGGLYPAIKAARLLPSHALRAE